MDDQNKSLYSFMFLMLFVTLLIFHTISKQAIPRDFRKTVVKVYSELGHGSGSIVKSTDKKSYILTNKHVCNGIALTKDEILLNKELQMGVIFVCSIAPTSNECATALTLLKKFEDSINTIGRTTNIRFNNLKHNDVIGKIVKLGKNVDLCLIELNEGNLPVMYLSRYRAVPGDKILSIGNPKYMTNAQTEGYVGDDMVYEDRNYQHHTGIIMGGNSGGPVCSLRGELVGVNTLGTPDPTASYMIPLEDIKNFLEE